MGPIHYSCLTFRRNFICQLPTISIIFSSGRKNPFGFHPGVSTYRFVHYEPHVDEYLDKKQSDVLKSFAVSDKDCQENPAIFKVHPQTLEHHGLVLREGGFTQLTASLLVNYYKIVKKTTRLLKIHGYIEQQTNVAKSFVRHLGNISLDQIKLSDDISDENQYIGVYNEVLRNYLVWRLESSLEEIGRIMKTYPRIRHRSLRYISWSLDILENQLDFSKEKILRHGYLIHSYPYNTLDTLERVPKLCGKDIKAVFHRHPKIIMTATDTLLTTANILKEHDIPDSAAQRCYEVFTLSSRNLQLRLQRLCAVPELRPFASHPRVVQMVHYQRKVNERLDQLQQLQRQCASLHLLISSQAYFERSSKEGMDRTRGSDVVALLGPLLDVDETQLRRLLNRHPFWCSVSLMALQRTLECLMERGYRPDAILRNVQLLLYPSEEVEKILEELKKSEALCEAQKLYKLAHTVDHVLTSSTELALCLYFLEKDHHFTGNGIWKT